MAAIDERTLDYLLRWRFGPAPSRWERLQIRTSRMLNRLGLSRLAALPLDKGRDEGREDELYAPPRFPEQKDNR
jgi:hypothetical protein